MCPDVASSLSRRAKSSCGLKGLWLPSASQHRESVLYKRAMYGERSQRVGVQTFVDNNSPQALQPQASSSDAT